MADQTKKLLEQLLAELYQRQAASSTPKGPSYLEAEDGQLLGKITSNVYDRESILNEYGPYGSRYSTTSIFNTYSQYGSPYGRYSVANPYCTTPPKLYINGGLVGHVSVNPHVYRRIPTEAFLSSLKNDLNGLLRGRISGSETETRVGRRESFIEAADGTFLGKLSPNKLDQESVFNEFGLYGNKFSQQSVFNKFSVYGNQFNTNSPFNQFSNNPPKLYVRGKFVAYLTKNRLLGPRVDPDELLEWAARNVASDG